MSVLAAPEVVNRANRKGIWGWMLFDWAAQPFFTVVTTFIFGPYFVARLAENDTVGQAWWAYGVAASGFIIAILSPVLGAIADKTGPRKPWIATFAVLKILALFALWWATPGSSLLWVITAFTIATVAAEFSTVFNDSMMSRLVSNKDIGKVSNIAWGLGYLGGMIVLIFVVAVLAASPETGKTIVGISPGIDIASGEDARLTGPIAAIWYLVFVLPMFMFTPDSGPGERPASAVRAGLADLKDTVKEIRRQPGIFRFLLARMVYQDGVNALLALGAPVCGGYVRLADDRNGPVRYHAEHRRDLRLHHGRLSGYPLRLEADRHGIGLRAAAGNPRHHFDRSGLHAVRPCATCRRPTAADCSEPPRNLPISATAC